MTVGVAAAEPAASASQSWRTISVRICWAYHLTAYSPAEGYRVMFNGSRGRLELDVEESTFTPPLERVTSSKGWVHGDLLASTAGRTTITLRPLWSPPTDRTVDHDHTGHGGADAPLLHHRPAGSHG